MYYLLNIMYKGYIIIYLLDVLPLFSDMLEATSSFTFQRSLISIGIRTIILIGLRRLTHYYKILHLGKFLRKRPSDEKLQKYVEYISKRRSIEGHPAIWGSLRETYRRVSRLDEIDYGLKVELFEALSLKGTRGIHPPRKSGNAYRQERESRIRQAGEEGERQLAYALRWLDQRRFKIFTNINLSSRGESQEFDSVVIGDNGVFNIEAKNYTGDLEIDEGGNWYRIINGNKSGTENPLFQVKRHNMVLNDILEGKIAIVDLIVWTNVESIIEGVQHSPVRIIKRDQLTHFIDSFRGERELSEWEKDFAIRAIEGNMKGSSSII